MKVAVLIVAAGRGTRIGGDRPKQYRPLAGRAILAHSIAAFRNHQGVHDVRVVVHADDFVAYEAATHGLDLGPPIIGGASRQASVALGLSALAADTPDLVLIHDAARPLVDAGTIDRVLQALEQSRGASAALPLSDTLKREQGGDAVAGPDRTGLWRVQTPQGFHFADILAAHKAAEGAELTDDAAVAERAGISVRLVHGAEDNFKVTYEADIVRAEQILMLRLGDVRTGSGFDTHAFVGASGGTLMLAGVAVPHDHALAGHSDADVALHALTDAVLGALADGDIGRHFPPSDMKWKGQPSDTFLRFAAQRVVQRGGVIAHLDLTIICEAPKISPHAAAMQARIAEIASVDPGRVSVKATTTEKLGFTGRREGIAAQAVATVRLPWAPPA